MKKLFESYYNSRINQDFQSESHKLTSLVNAKIMQNHILVEAEDRKIFNPNYNSVDTEHYRTARYKKVDEIFQVYNNDFTELKNNYSTYKERDFSTNLYSYVIGAMAYELNKPEGQPILKLPKKVPPAVPETKIKPEATKLSPEELLNQLYDQKRSINLVEIEKALVEIENKGADAKYNKHNNYETVLQSCKEELAAFKEILEKSQLPDTMQDKKNRLLAVIDRMLSKDEFGYSLPIDFPEHAIEQAFPILNHIKNNIKQLYYETTSAAPAADYNKIFDAVINLIDAKKNEVDKIVNNKSTGKLLNTVRKNKDTIIARLSSAAEVPEFPSKVAPLSPPPSPIASPSSSPSSSPKPPSSPVAPASGELTKDEKIKFWNLAQSILTQDDQLKVKEFLEKNKKFNKKQKDYLIAYVRSRFLIDTHMKDFIAYVERHSEKV